MNLNIDLQQQDLEEKQQILITDNSKYLALAPKYELTDLWIPESKDFEASGSFYFEQSVDLNQQKVKISFTEKTKDTEGQLFSFQIGNQTYSIDKDNAVTYYLTYGDHKHFFAVDQSLKTIVEISKQEGIVINGIPTGIFVTVTDDDKIIISRSSAGIVFTINYIIVYPLLPKYDSDKLLNYQVGRFKIYFDIIYNHINLYLYSDYTEKIINMAFLDVPFSTDGKYLTIQGFDLEGIMYIDTNPYSLKGDMLLVLDNNLQYCNMKFYYRGVEPQSYHSEIEFGEIPEDADILNFSLADIKIIPILTQHKSQIKDNNTIIDSNIVDIPKDGYYTLTYLIIPKEEYVNKLLELDSNLVNLFTDIFYYKDNSVFNKKGQQEVDINTFIERNLKGTNVLRYSKDFCSIFFLQKCYYNLCMKLLKNNDCTTCNYDGSELSYYRDIMFMGLQTIRYLSLKGRFMEAQNIVERFQSCSNICNNTYNEDCRCNK